MKRTRKPNPGLNPGFHQFGGLGFYFSITSKPGFFILSFCCCYIEQSESDCVISIMNFLMRHTKKSSFHLERKNLSKRSNFLAFIYSKWRYIKVFYTYNNNTHNKLRYLIKKPVFLIILKNPKLYQLTGFL